MLKSHKGRGGGFVLETSPSKVTILDLIEIFHGPFHREECTLKKKVCPKVKTCVLKKKLDKIEKGVAKLKLKSMNIQIDTLTPEQRKYLSSWEMGT